MYRSNYSRLQMRREKFHRENRTHDLGGGVRVSLNKTAFTLIELLVVIAIISLLVSILLPSLNKAKDLAKRAVCSAQLRGLGTSHILYAQDHNGDFFYVEYNGSKFAAQWNFPDYYPVVKWGGYAAAQFDDQLVNGGYLDSKDSYYCPNYENGMMTFYSIEDEWSLRRRIGYCSFVNSYWKPDGNGCASPDYSFEKQKVDNVANVLPGEAMAQDIYVESTGGLMGAGSRYAHEDGGNVLFADNHVEFVALDDLSYGHNTSNHYFLPGTWWMYPEKM